MIDYDSKLMYEFADRLYKQAAQVVFSSIVWGLIVGLFVGGAGDYLLAGSRRISVGLLAVAGAAIGVFLGYVAGREKAFALKLRAQTALCQAKIEENTRTKAVV